MPVQQAYQHLRPRNAGLADGGVLSALPYDWHVINDGPWGFWPMTEASGTTIADMSGNGRDGSVVGSPTLGQSGWPGQGTAIAFSNNNADYINIASTTGLTGTDRYTWEALVYYVSGDGAVASRGTATTDGVHALEVASATEIRIFNWADFYAATVPSVASAWHHMAITWDGVERHIYLDGLEWGAGNAYIFAGWPNNNIFIGRTTGSGLPFNGKIQKVAYFTRALSAAEIAAHFAVLDPA